MRESEPVVWSRADLETNYEHLLAVSGLSTDLQTWSLSDAITQSTSGSQGRTLVLPRSHADIVDIYKRGLKYYMGHWGHAPRTGGRSSLW